MTKKIYWIRFRENYDVDGVDEVCDRFNGADHIYDDKVVRFIGSPERLQEFIRALKAVETDITYK